MKLKIFSVFVCLFLLSAAVFTQTVPAQGESASAPESSQFLCGLAQKEITPPLSFPMAGYYNRRLSSGTLDPLMAKSFCFRQGDKTCVLLICDVISLREDCTTDVRKRVSEKTGIPAECIFITATHTHTGPTWDKYTDITPEKNLEAAKKNDLGGFSYSAWWVEQCVAVILESMEKVEPASFALTQKDVHGLSFNRRFFMKDSDQVRFNPGILNPNIIRPAGPIDPQFYGILFSRDSGKAFASLSSFALHLDTTGGLFFSADYPHYIETVLREKYGPEFVSVFGIGTCGDINHIDVTTRQRRKAPEIGTSLGQVLVEMYAGEMEAQKPSLGSTTRMLNVKRQEFTEEEIKQAELIRKEIMNPESTYTFLERVKAGKVVSLKNMPVDQTAEIGAIRLSSDTAIVTLPGEVFVDLGLEIKKRSPFKNTLVIELSRQNAKYVPTEKAFREGSYETINSLFVPGTGERFVEAALDCLNELKGK